MKDYQGTLCCSLRPKGLFTKAGILAHLPSEESPPSCSKHRLYRGSPELPPHFLFSDPSMFNSLSLRSLSLLKCPAETARGPMSSPG